MSAEGCRRFALPSSNVFAHDLVRLYPEWNLCPAPTIQLIYTDARTGNSYTSSCSKDSARYTLAMLRIPEPEKHAEALTALIAQEPDASYTAEHVSVKKKVYFPPKE